MVGIVAHAFDKKIEKIVILVICFQLPPIFTRKINGKEFKLDTKCLVIGTILQFNKIKG